MRAALLALLATSSVAYADEAPTIESAFPPTLRVANPSSSAGTILERVTIERGELVWVTLELRAWQRTSTTAELAVDLPAGARVIGLELARDRTTAWGGPIFAATALRRFRDAGAPAVLEWVGATGGVEHHALHVDNIAHGKPTRVTLAIELPAITSLAIATGVPTFVDGRRTRGPIAIAGSDPHETYAAVDAETSLFADTVINDRVPMVFIDQNGGVRWSGGLDSHMIRRVVRAHHEQLRRCYMLEAQRDPTLAGTAELHFMVEQDGTVSTSSVSGSLPNQTVFDCLAREVASWQVSGGNRPGWRGPRHLSVRVQAGSVLATTTQSPSTTRAVPPSRCSSGPALGKKCRW